MKSATALESGKELFHLRPDPYASLIDSKDHIQLPVASASGWVELTAQTVSQAKLTEAFSSSLGSRSEIERRDSRMTGSLELSRASGGRAELLPEKQIVEAIPAVANRRAGAGMDRSVVPAHLLSDSVPAQVSSSEIYPLNSAAPGQLAEIEDRFAVAIRFVPAEGALTRKIEQILGEYPYMVCLEREICRKWPARTGGTMTTMLAKKIQALRAQAPDVSLTVPGPAARLHGLKQLESPLAFDLALGRVEAIEVIYAIPVLRRVDWSAAAPVVTALTQMRERFRKGFSDSSVAFEAGLKLGSLLAQAGIRNPSEIDRILARLSNAEGKFAPASASDPRIQFTAEKVTYLSQARLAGAGEAAPEIEWIWIFARVVLEQAP